MVIPLSSVFSQYSILSGVMQLPGFDMAGIRSYNEEKRLGGELLAVWPGGACEGNDDAMIRLSRGEETGCSRSACVSAEPGLLRWNPVPGIPDLRPKQAEKTCTLATHNRRIFAYRQIRLK
jgi:hypothetical protein